ncbi:hypothetical protein [Brevundimonas sp. A19_0]|uniref:hypothetical protein n=1 Tax=Brevundimonas sp. A19_0 TaxID=2821087 RepID=UPI001ADD151F|nr:hypothetical protein [Brevundimonas sp. A19_0]MBO9502047.1 hypothetical protein [Brevundimonas sp. A19_0]
MPVYVITASQGRKCRPAAKPRMRLIMGGERSPHSPHAEPGDTLFIDAAASGQVARRRVLETKCVFRASVVIDEHGLVRVIDPRRTIPGTGLAYAVLAAENGTPPASLDAARKALANLAGFADWKRLWAYHTHQDRSWRPDANGQLRLQIVGWA